MKRTITTISILSVILFVIYRIAKSKGISLGKLTNRPPKVRIVYSKKLKASERPKISSSTDVVNLLRELWSSQIEVREEFLVLLMDRDNRVLGYQVLSKGGMSGTVVDTRLMLSMALESLATSIIIAHNHPSGSLKPSTQDINITKKVKESGKTMDIQVLDHIIITKESHFSFADEGIL